MYLVAPPQKKAIESKYYLKYKRFLCISNFIKYHHIIGAILSSRMIRSTKG